MCIRVFYFLTIFEFENARVATRWGFGKKIRAKFFSIITSF